MSSSSLAAWRLAGPSTRRSLRGRAILRRLRRVCGRRGSAARPARRPGQARVACRRAPAFRAGAAAFFQLVQVVERADDDGLDLPLVRLEPVDERLQLLHPLLGRLQALAEGRVLLLEDADEVDGSSDLAFQQPDLLEGDHCAAARRGGFCGRAFLDAHDRGLEGHRVLDRHVRKGLAVELHVRLAAGRA